MAGFYNESDLLDQMQFEDAYDKKANLTNHIKRELKRLPLTSHLNHSNRGNLAKPIRKLALEKNRTKIRNESNESEARPSSTGENMETLGFAVPSGIPADAAMQMYAAASQSSHQGQGGLQAQLRLQQEMAGGHYQQATMIQQQQQHQQPGQQQQAQTLQRLAQQDPPAAAPTTPRRKRPVLGAISPNTPRSADFATKRARSAKDSAKGKEPPKKRRKPQSEEVKEAREDEERVKEE